MPALVWQTDQLVESHPAFRARTARHFDPEYGGLGNARDAIRASGQFGQVIQQQTNDLAETQGNDGQIVAAQAQHRKAEQKTEARGTHGSQRQTHPE